MAPHSKTDSPQSVPEFASRFIDLVQPRMGGAVLSATDDFFGPKERVISAEAPIFVPGKYDQHGKWMDGWETRRLRGDGHDHCVVKLGLPGKIHGVDIDTSFFDGNHPTAASLEACAASGDRSETCFGDQASWYEIVPRTELGGNRHHYIEVEDERQWSHLRLHIYPDGGVARLRVYGEVICDWSIRDPGRLWDLAAVENGGRALAWSDDHFGAAHPLLFPGRGVDMGDGWETRRRRGPGHDWVVLSLGCAGRVEEIEIDTAHFKGNYPDRCSVDGALTPGAGPPATGWRALLPEQKLRPDAEHRFSQELIDHDPVDQVRINIFPDGGLSRVRIFGRPATEIG